MESLISGIVTVAVIGLFLYARVGALFSRQFARTPNRDEQTNDSWDCNK